MIFKNKVYALDLGTTKFCFATVVEKDHDQVPNIHFITVPANGMRRGMLENFEQAKQSLNTLIESAESELQTQITQTVVGIAGSHLTSQMKTCVQIEDKVSTVNHKTLENLKAKAKIESSVLNKEILHVVPISYQIDNRDSLKNPFGFSFSKITGNFLIIYADKLYLTDVVKLCNSCGIEVKRLYAEPYASASVILTDQAKEAGVVIADIGGGTTDGIIFSEGSPKKVFTVNIGGKLMTSDLSIGLGIPIDEAEKIKRAIGLHPNQQKTIETHDIYKNSKNIYQEAVHNILGPRVTELANLINKETQKEKIFLAGGLILTGGGSETLGMTDYMNHTLPYQTKKIHPSLPLEVCKYLNMTQSSLSYSTQLATVLGLLYLENIHQSQIQSPNKTWRISKYFRELAIWFKELS